METLFLAAKNETSDALRLLGIYVVALVVLVIIGMMIGRGLYRRRKAKRIAWGEQYGLTILDPAGINEKLTSYGETEVALAVLAEYEGFGLAEADRAMAKNILEGQVDGNKTRVFDYKYTLGTGEDVISTDFGVVAIELPVRIALIQFMSRRFRDKVPKDDLPFERKEFNDRFHVFHDDDQILAQRMSVELERELIDSPIYECTGWGRFLIVKAANKISNDKYTELLSASRGLAKLLQDSA